MRRFSISFALVFFSSICLAQTFEAGSPEEQRSTVEPTKRAAHLLDSDQLGVAWDESARALQEKTGRLVFVLGIQTMRAAVGEVKTRKLKAVGFLNDLPEAPKGRYAATFFETEFNRVTAEEKFVFFQEGKSWRLAGYFINKRYSVPSK
jgi:hypothetical protein